MAHIILDLVGASLISRKIFGTTKQRRLVPMLREQGWPITDVNGKPAANSDLLNKEIVRRLNGAKPAEATESETPRAAPV
jgi:hypothetical protein